MKKISFLTSLLVAGTLVLSGCSQAGKDRKGIQKGLNRNPALNVKGPVKSFGIDNVHSFIIFKIKHMNAGYVFGRFNGIGGYVYLDDKDPAKSKIILKIDVASIDTNNPKRDGHLRSPDFFDAKKFPIATYSSKKISSGDNKVYQVTGNFNLHGITKELTVEFTRTGFLAKDLFGFTRAGGVARVLLNRSDYGVVDIDKKMPGLVGNEVELMIALEGVYK